MKRPRLVNPLTVLHRRVTATRQTWHAARLWEAGQRSLLDAVAPEWVEHTPTSYAYGADGDETYTRTLVVRDWPAQVQAGWLAPVLFDLGGDVSVALHSDRLPIPQAIRRLRTQRVLQTSVAQARLERGAISDPAEQLDLASAEEIAKAVAAGEEALFSVGLSLTLRAPSLGELDALERRVRDRLDAQGVSLSGMRWQHAAGFQTAGMVYGTDRLGASRRRTLDTTTLAMSCPFLTGDVGTQGGPLLGVALADRAPVRLDTWATDEGWIGPHLVIIAPNGAGKTVTIGHLGAEWLTQPDPPQVLFIDPVKLDFSPLVEAVGGRVVSQSTDPEEVINPYDVPPAEVQSGTGTVRRVNALLAHVRQTTGLIALMAGNGHLELEERAAYEEAALAAYAAKGIVPDNAATWGRGGKDVPLLADVVTHLQRDPSGEKLAGRLRPFTTGTLRRLFDRPTSLTLTERAISFDLSGLDDQLRSIAVWTVGNLVWKLARTDRRRRILSLDEVKTLLAYEESARLVGDLYALARAYNVSVWSASQLTSDYQVTQEGERVLQNAYTTLLLHHARGKGVQEAGDRYGLSDSDRQYLERCDRGQGLLITPKGAARVAVRPSPLELEWLGGAAAPPVATSGGQSPAAPPVLQPVAG